MAAAILLLAIFGVTHVLSQATHNTGTFTYRSCSTVDLSCFGPPIVFSDGRLLPEACQLACKGHQFAALFPDSCRCGDDAKAVQPVDERKCDHPCMGDSNLGMWGSICPENDPRIANVYTRVTAPTQGPSYGEPAGPQAPPAPAETPCPSSEAGPSGGSPGSAPRITPIGPAPEVPSAVAPPVENPAPTGPPSSQSPPQESPCASEDDPAQGMPAPPAQSPHVPPGNAPEPKTYSEPAQPAPETTPAPNPPDYFPECPSIPSGSYSDGHNPDGSPAQDPYNCKPGGSDLSPVPSDSTLWPRPGSTSRPGGDPPVPSQVPGSDSTHGIVSPLSSIRGLVLLAAMII